jgi:hypothetical protein
MVFQDCIGSLPLGRAGYYRRLVKTRSYLYLLVAGALAPMVVFAVVAALLLLQHEREIVERDAVGGARAAMSAVDAHLRASIVALETLAASKNLESGDIAAFHAESQRVLRTQPGWVNIGLASAAKMQLFNAIYALGKPEPLDRSSAEDESFAAVLRGAKAGVSSVAAGTAVRSPTVRVRVPVAYGGEVRYVISAPLNLKYLIDLLQAHRLPEDWVIVLVDRQKSIIAQIPARPAGTSAPDSLKQAIERSPEGWFQGVSPEGRSGYTAYVTSQLSGWVLGIAIPADALEASAQRTWAILGAGVVLAGAVGMLLASLIARRMP